MVLLVGEDPVRRLFTQRVVHKLRAQTPFSCPTAAWVLAALLLRFLVHTGMRMVVLCEGIRITASLVGVIQVLACESGLRQVKRNLRHDAANKLALARVHVAPIR